MPKALLTTPYSDDQDHTLFVTCSDPRFFKSHLGMLLHLSIMAPTPIIHAGGPGFFIRSPETKKWAGILHRRFEFSRVIGVAHHGCAFYGDTFPELSPAEIAKQQIRELGTFAEHINSIAPHAQTELYFVQRNNGFLSIKPLA